MKRAYRVGLTLLTAAVLALGIFGQARADTFNQNNIIDDGVFDNSGSMSSASIDSWLNANFPSSCISTNSGFSAPDPTGYSPSGGYTYGGNVSAGRVISDAARAYGLNPQVLLATLQKEEGLVQGNGPYGCGALAMSAAVGYGCPDGGASYSYSGINLYTRNGTTYTSVSGTCVNSAAKAGFSQQIIHAAWLLKFGEQRSEGNIGWDVQLTNYPQSGDSWNNSDDPETCYGGPMTQGTYQVCPSGPSNYYDGYTTIDGTSVHMDDGATAALYWYTPHFSGNQSFFNIFTGWFGTTHATPFFRISGNTQNIYILGGSNNYYHVTSPGELANYGYGTAFLSISTLDSSYVNSLTNSGDLPAVASFGGSEIYLFDGGGIRWFPNYATYQAFGYSNNAVLPSWVYSKVVRGADMHTVVKESWSPNIYYIHSGKRSLITSYEAYTTLGSPYSSLPTVTLGTHYAETLPIGEPIMVAGTLAQASDTGAYGVWDGTYYQTINSSAVRDTGFSPDYITISAALNQLTPNPTSLNKLAKDSGGTMYILDYKKKLTVSNGQLSALGLSSGSFVTTDDTFLGKFSTASMQTLIKTSSSTAVYDVISGQLYHIYSGTDFNGLGYSSSNIATVNGTTAGLFTNNGRAEFQQERLVKVSGTVQIYLIDGTFTKFYIPSMAVFSAYGFSSGSIVTATSTELGGYSTTANLPVVVKDGSSNYWLVDSGVKHQMSATMLSASYYNIDTSTVPLLTDVAFSRLTTSSALTQYIKASNDSKVYGVSNGQKHWYTSSSSFLADGGTWNSVITLSAAYVNSLPTGSSI